MNNKKIEEHIANAVEVITPNIFDKVSNAVISKNEIQESNVIYKKPKNQKKLTFGFAAMCAATIMLLIGINIYYNRIDSTIYIDVNPSIEITANEEDKVLSAYALNDDANIIIDGMDLNKVDLETAVETIIESMVKNGFISETQNSILLSVSNKDEKKANEMNELLSLNISDSLKKSNINVVVYNQQLTVNEDLKKLASQYGISVGKTEFLTKLIEKDSGLDLNQLSVMKIQEIVNLAHSLNINLHNITNFEDNTKEQKNNNESKQEINSTEINENIDKNTEDATNEENNTKDLTNENTDIETNEENNTQDITNEIDEKEVNEENETEDVTNENDGIKVNEDNHNVENNNDETEITEGDNTEETEEINSNDVSDLNTDEENMDDTQNEEDTSDNDAED